MAHRLLNIIHLGLLATVAGLMVGAAPASAQGYPADYPDQASSGPPEDVIVVAPRMPFREQGGSLDLPPDRVSLSMHVRYDDLDLASQQGAYELRARVRHAAHHVCRQLAEAYPFQRLSTSNTCYRDAVENGLLRADQAINTAVDRYFYGYD
jgi:UrcA family protein